MYKKFKKKKKKKKKKRKKCMFPTFGNFGHHWSVDIGLNHCQNMVLVETNPIVRIHIIYHLHINGVFRHLVTEVSVKLS